MNSDDLKYKMALTQIPGLGPVNAKNLISYCGGIKEIFNTSEKKLLKTPGIGKITARSIIQSKQLPEDYPAPQQRLVPGIVGSYRPDWLDR